MSIESKEGLSPVQQIPPSLIAMFLRAIADQLEKNRVGIIDSKYQKEERLKSRHGHNYEIRDTGKQAFSIEFYGDITLYAVMAQDIANHKKG
jgi:hypothetical protein